MEVFYNLPAPWFQFVKTDQGTIGEDFWFCQEARKAGYKIFVDTSVPSGHLATIEVTDQMYRFHKAVIEFNKLKSTGGK